MLSITAGVIPAWRRLATRKLNVPGDRQAMLNWAARKKASV
ncbi:hypothetical protein PSYMO_15471 [Pseudomonas amygdali pv. mori str. 301020]|uniref:Uncharacterized protein n=3 Tax=Pseudomonas amygdali TaxID=47877 RepID=A0A3M5J0R4_PSEA0|nr:hypothetical protein PSYMO_15471 [Pseudomonas amygdali pv. mori str. 301020]RMT16626.1 hypothetical protein ALP52_102786 [Pseudomonas amygdali pv. mori]